MLALELGKTFYELYRLVEIYSMEPGGNILMKSKNKY